MTLLGIVAERVGHAQQQVVFEAASIKPAVQMSREGGNRSRIEHTPISLTMSNVTLSDCVQWAYGVAFFQISAVRLSADSYDIHAKAEAPMPVGQLRIMFRDLLAKRFKLALQREMKVLPAYELVVAKGGPKLPPANTGTSLPQVHAAESLPRIQDGSFAFRDVSMAEFGQMLAQLREIDLPVVDRTGINGTFNIILKSAAKPTADPDRPSLFAIVQEQLGLRLVPGKAQVEVLVIDHAEKPSEN